MPRLAGFSNFAYYHARLLVLGGLLVSAGSTPAQGQSCLSWINRTAPGGPSARSGHAMAYDIARGVTVLFGGSPGGAETWEWNGGGWTNRAVSGPSARYDHAMAYDSARGVTVLFGGYAYIGGGNYSYNNETWEWDESAWTLRANDGPSPRVGHALAFDSARGVTVLFGGFLDTNQPDGETWEWDGSTWTLRSSGGPEPRQHHAMAYDTARGFTVLFGGQIPAPPYYKDDTWEWDGNAWTQRALPPDNAPVRRAWSALAYDSDRQVSVLFGGYLGGYLNDTWEWDGDSWVQQTISGPYFRYSHAMAYDIARARVMLFGGVVDNVGVSGETWSLEVTVAPTITQQPVSQSIVFGQPVSLSVTADGSQPMTFQWRKGGQDLANVGRVTGVTTATLTIDPTCPADAGSYDVIVTNPCDALTSTAVNLTISEPSGILYVNDAATGANDGSNWFDALTSLQDALRIALACTGATTEIWVAAGAYKPDRGVVHTLGDRAATFSLVNSVGVYGGFAGTETSRSQRNPSENVTVLSGDLAGDDGPNFANDGENSRRVVTAAPTSFPPTLDGFTVTAGNNTDRYDDLGAGIYVANYVNIVRCRIVANRASVGGGLAVRGGVPTVIGCIISGNWGIYDAGGVYNEGGAPTLINCVLSGNRSDVYPGAFLNQGGNCTLINCTLSGNTGQVGGYVHRSGVTTLTNCILFGNTYFQLWVQNPNQTNYVVLQHSLVEGYAGDIHIQGTTPGAGVIRGNPRFVDGDGPDNNPGTPDDDLRLGFCSPCIDAGRNSALPADVADLDADGNTTEPTPLDMAGDARFTDVPTTSDTGDGAAPLVDMGAYEASTPPAPVALPLIYVTQAAAGSNDGTSWANAFTDLQSALTLAFQQGCIVAGTEIWVAAGTYTPSSVGDTSQTFRLRNNLALYGGFLGGETQLSERDSIHNLSILSGAGYVVTASGTDASVVLDGFTITAPGGVAVYDQEGSPAIVNCRLTSSSVGLYVNLGGSPTVSGCTFSGNSIGADSYYADNLAFTDCTFSDNFGQGGMFNWYTAQVEVTTCTFTNNGGNSGGWGGGGLFNYNTDINITRCLFEGNVAPSGGGASFTHAEVTPPSIIVTNSEFRGNAATGNGGGAYVSVPGTPVFVNTLFSRNTAAGGGAFYGGNSNPILTHCTLADNTGTGVGGGLLNNGGYPILRNCILYGNTDTAFNYNNQSYGNGQNTQLYDYYHQAIVNYCLVERLNETLGGVGNFDIAPGLARDGRLRADSPCINAGDPGFVVDPAYPTDIDGEPRVLGTRVDIGCDEFQDTDGDGLPDAWESRYFGSPTAAPPNDDPDGDGLSNRTEFELYGSHPAAPPYYVDTVAGDDAYDGRAAAPGSPGVGPKKSIQAGINAASLGDTVLVLPGAYSGAGNKELDYAGKSLVVRAAGGPAVTTIDCGGSGGALAYSALSFTSSAIVGFTITGGSGDYGGGIRAESSRVLLDDLVLAGNSATIRGGGLFAYLGTPTLGNITLGENSAPSGDHGALYHSDVNLQGVLHVSGGTLASWASSFSGPGGIDLGPAAVLGVVGNAPFASSPTVIRSNITGTGDIVIDLDQQLRIEEGAVVDLSGTINTSGCVDTDPKGWGTIHVEGVLFVRDATIQNTNVEVNLGTGIGSGTQIINNDLRLLETAPGFGGEFFVEGDTTIQCNHIVSQGDRYLDLDPEADNPNLNIADNRIEVFITQGAGGEQGELLELRARDYDNVLSNGLSGTYELASSPGYDDTWTLERLEILPGAKLNLTNRQGFEFSTNGFPDALYVKDLVLDDSAVLNTGLQRLYYQNLNLGSGAQLMDIPVLGFSLKVIAMEDDTEFGVRVRQRLREPLDVQDCRCDGTCVNNSPPQDVTTCKEGAVTRIISDPLGIPPGHGGVMDVLTRASTRLSASSVAAKGAFARAGEDEIVVAFEYLFVENPAAELIVYLSDTPEAAPGGCSSNGACDNDCCEVARVYMPAPGRDGAIGSGEFASFYGEFPRGNLNFHRGTYVELELRGADARVWIDDWDPRIRCSGCADLNGTGGPEGEDYLLLLASFGLDIDANMHVETGAQENADCFDSVLGGDRYVDTGDLLAWDTFLDEDALNACGTGVRSEPRGLPPRSSGQGNGKQGTGNRSTVANPLTVHPSPVAQSPTPEGWGTHSVHGTQSSVLIVAGKPNGAGVQDDYVYPVDTNGACSGGSPQPPASGAGTRGHGRLVAAPDGTLYQLHSTGGVLPLGGGPALVVPATNLTPTSDSSLRVTVGVNDFGGGQFLGLPIADAAFHPTDTNVLYVVPVLVIPLTGLPPCDYYKAAAKLVRSGGNYTVERLYEVPAANRTPPCDFPPQLDQGEFREIEVSADGAKVFIASARADNDNDWVLVFNESPGALTTAALVGEVPPEGMMPAGLTLTAPLAMLASRTGATPYLYLAAGVNAAPSETVGGQSVPRTRVFRFDVSSGVVFAGALDISNPECVNPYDTLGCTSTLTALAENPNDGTLYALGFVAPRFDVDYPYNFPPFGGPNPNQIVIFTTPTVATIPTGATWSITVPPAPPAAAQATADLVTCADLALPISLAWNPAGCGAPGDMDGDGDVQLDDWADFAGCLTGPTVTLGGGCDCADVDADEDTDLADVAGFLGNFGT